MKAVVKPLIRKLGKAMGAGDTLKALLNILEDEGQQEKFLESSQQATVNILADAEQKAKDLEINQIAMLNLLEDAERQTKFLSDSQRATTNILEDLDVARDKAEQERARDEALLSSIGDGVIAVDYDERTIFVNKVAEKMLGWSFQELRGHVFTDIVTLEDQKGELVSKEKMPLQHALKFSTTTTTTTYFFIRKDKTKFPVAITASPVMSADKIMGAVQIFRDITHEKEIERQKGEFATLASHQLRTPLSGTKWLIETMQKGITGTITEKQKKYLDAKYNLNERMIKLVSE
ncbi:MAG: PAS domain S-box protein, partial [bacterium]|nr:PAS domain S-box protein [bacterium]